MNKKYEEAAALTNVAESMITFGQDVITYPEIPSEEVSSLRVALIQEELNELKYAISVDDILEVAGAFADLQYVLSGGIHAFGMGNTFGSLFNEVHRSNMSKACETKEEAGATIAKYHADGVSSYYEGKEGKYLVKRRSDNKGLNAINYSTAELLPILSGVKNPPLEALRPPHQQRVLDEKEALDIKCAALLTFISDNKGVYSNLSAEERGDLYIQLQQMMHYSDTLSRRIRRF